MAGDGDNGHALAITQHFGSDRITRIDIEQDDQVGNRHFHLAIPGKQQEFVLNGDARRLARAIIEAGQREITDSKTAAQVALQIGDLPLNSACRLRAFAAIGSSCCLRARITASPMAIALV